MATGRYLGTGTVSPLLQTPHWFQCGFGSIFLPLCGSGSRESNQCGAVRIRILEKLNFTYFKNILNVDIGHKIYATDVGTKAFLKH